MASSSRRKAREGALRALYEVELGGAQATVAIEAAEEHLDLTGPLRDYLRFLVEGVLREQLTIDAHLERVLHGYELDRLVPVDRNVLRLAAFELLFEPNIAPAIVIDEAVEIAKKFSTAESGKFVNGVLGRVLQKSPKAKWKAQEHVFEPEEPDEEPEPEPEVEVIEEDSEIAKTAVKIGAWKIRRENNPPAE